MYQVLTELFYKHHVFAPSNSHHSKGTAPSDRRELQVTERLAKLPRITQPESHKVRIKSDSLPRPKSFHLLSALTSMWLENYGSVGSQERVRAITTLLPVCLSVGASTSSYEERMKETTADVLAAH